MKTKNNLFLIVVLLFFGLTNCKETPKESFSLVENQKPIDGEPLGVDNVAYQWGHMIIQGTANDTEKFKPRPTVSSRFLALMFTSIFDAWTRFDDKATPLYITDVERRPEAERTLKNKEIAVSYAAYRTLLEYYDTDSLMFTNKMKELGLDPNNTSLDPTTPEGIGNLAAKTVIAARINDGSNQIGDIEGSDGKPYSDYSGYKSVNDADNNVDIDRWQPIYFSDGKGGTFAPGCLTPFWPNVKPLLMETGDQFRPGPPPLVGSEQLALEVKEVVEMQSNLTPENKALVEFMRDGPMSVQQAGHWLKFSQDVSKRDNHSLDQDVKMYFLVESVAMDGFIACWDAKMAYDSARPIALVHHYYKDQEITGWGGPDKGMMTMKASDWRPYSPEIFLSPPFPGYVSGHSTISGGCAEALKLFTGSDTFGVEVEVIPGALTEPNNVGEAVTLKFPTFTETAEMAGISRVMGGYHIEADNIEGLELGRKVAHYNYKKYLELIGEDDKNLAQLK